MTPNAEHAEWIAILENLEKRANAYRRWVEFAKFVASQDPNGMTAQGNRARALLSELGETYNSPKD